MDWCLQLILYQPVNLYCYIAVRSSMKLCFILYLPPISWLLRTPAIRQFASYFWRDWVSNCCGWEYFSLVLWSAHIKLVWWQLIYRISTKPSFSESGMSMACVYRLVSYLCLCTPRCVHTTLIKKFRFQANSDWMDFNRFVISV